jgi:hypothetical protein
MAKTDKHEVTTPAPAGLSTSTEMPDFLKGSTGTGNENVQAADLVIPRLAIIQSQSPELDEDNAEKFIPGSKMGQMFNTLTREAMDYIFLVDCFYRKEYVVFVKRTEGGGFRGSYSTQAEANAAINESDAPDKLEVSETALHFCLVVNPDTGKAITEVVVPMTSTKLKVSRNWNSMIRMRGGDRFAGIWKLTTRKEKNDKGTFYNFTVTPGPWVNEEIYAKAKELYEAVSSGVKDVDRTDTGAEPGAEEKRF